MLPILGICQGFQLIQLLVSDLYHEDDDNTPNGLTEQLSRLEAQSQDCPTRDERRLRIRDSLLTDLRMFNQSRTTQFQVTDPSHYALFAEFPAPTL